MYSAFFVFVSFFSGYTYQTLEAIAAAIFQCYRPQTWQFYLVFPALFISGTHKVLGLKLRVGRSRDQVGLQSVGQIVLLA